MLDGEYVEYEKTEKEAREKAEVKLMHLVNTGRE
jgi:hypothetical protein